MGGKACKEEEEEEEEKEPRRSLCSEAQEAQGPGGAVQTGGRVGRSCLHACCERVKVTCPWM